MKANDIRDEYFKWYHELPLDSPLRKADRDERYMFFLEKKIESLKCCGNCKWFDIIDNRGGVCMFDRKDNGVPCDRTALPCDTWELVKII